MESNPTIGILAMIGLCFVGCQLMFPSAHWPYMGEAIIFLLVILASIRNIWINRKCLNPSTEVQKAAAPEESLESSSKAEGKGTP